MNTQEIFDTVVNHLRQQGAKALRGDILNTIANACAYRSPAGLSCAFGCLIHDDEYKPEFEGMSVMGVLQKTSCPQSLKDRLGITEATLADPYAGTIALLQSLQNVHDLVDVSGWEMRLKEVAHQYNLVYTPPVQS